MNRVLITGGSSGIGFEISRHFAKDGYQILWISKPKEELVEAQERLKSEFPRVEVKYIALDLSAEEAPRKAYNWAKEQGAIDVVINNAGFGTYGFIDEIEMEKELAMIKLNILCVYQLTRLFLKDMLKSNSGTIINISSNTSLQPVPRMATYAATKAFVKHLSQSIQEELIYKKSKVRVMTICPAAIKDTKFQQVANMEKVRTFESITTTTPEEVARDTYNGFKKGRNLVLTGSRLRMSMVLAKVLPVGLIKWMLKRELDRT